MAHYSVELVGCAPIDWSLLRKQRDRLVRMASATDHEEDRRALDGIINLLDAMIDSHDRVGPL